MLFNFFKIDRHKSVSKLLDKLLPNTPLVSHIQKTRIRTATATKGYKYLAEGTVQNRKFVLSVQADSNDLDQPLYQVEIILHCENPSWINLKMAANTSLLELNKSLDLKRIKLNDLLSDSLSIACNQTAFIQRSFDTTMLRLAQSIEWNKMRYIQLSRKRLYIRSQALSTTAIEASLLQNLMLFSTQLLDKTDQVTP